MTDEKQEGQKTIVSFIVGLLIGGLLVWAFSGPTAEAPKEEKKEDSKSEEVTMEKNEDKPEEVTATATTPAPTLNVGEGEVKVENQNAGNIVALGSATYPVAEGWIGVRDYTDGRLGGLLGVARFSQEQGLVPNAVPLQRPTVSGKEYAVVVYTESGDLKFNLAEDKQLDSVFATFTAN